MRWDELERALEGARRRYQLRLDIGTSASGNWGHRGVPGQHGGSAKGGGKKNRISTESGFSSEAKKRAAERKARKEAGQNKAEKQEKKQEEQAPGIAGSKVTAQRSIERLQKAKEKIMGKSIDERIKFLYQVGRIDENGKRALDPRSDYCSYEDDSQLNKVLEDYFQSAEEARRPQSIECPERDKVAAMSRDERKGWIRQACREPLPEDLNQQSRTQRVVYQMGMKGTPQVLCEEDFDDYVNETGAEVIYRGVRNIYGMTGKMMFDQMAYDKEKPYMGLGMYGDGLYFSNEEETAYDYAGVDTDEYTGDLPNPSTLTSGAVARCALRKDAKVIEYDDLLDQMFPDGPDNEYFYTASDTGAINEGAYAACAGYDAIRVKQSSGESYTVVLNRAALIMEDPNDGLHKALAG